MSGARLARQLGLFSTTMAVVGGIVGAGIFINPYLVAQRVHTVPLILGAWIAGGIVALLGGFIYAELAARAPVVGGQYAYLRDSLHPAVAFVYGWVLLLVIQTGGMAAVAVTFARYLLELTSWPVADSVVAVAALAVLTLINCLGVRAGSRFQSSMTLTAIAAIALLEIFSFSHPPAMAAQTFREAMPGNLVLAFGSAMTPVLFAYGGWQTSSFLGGEVRDAKRILPRALILGVLVVIIVYTSVNFAYLRELGPAGLAQTTTPASAVMRVLLGEAGAKVIAAGIAFSAFGFLAQSMLTAPRVYFAMAEDGVFFRKVAWVHPRTRVPVVAIALQGVCAILIAITGTYAQVVNYVVAMDCIFFGLTAACLILMRRRESTDAIPIGVPFYPWTILVFIAAEWLVVASTFVHDWRRSVIGLVIALAGLPVYAAWRRTSR
ncbi:MAG: APC family permease [Chthoniobacterales bacterium]